MSITLPSLNGTIEINGKEYILLKSYNDFVNESAKIENKLKQSENNAAILAEIDEATKDILCEMLGDEAVEEIIPASNAARSVLYAILLKELHKFISGTYKQYIIDEYAEDDE